MRAPAIVALVVHAIAGCTARPSMEGATTPDVQPLQPPPTALDLGVPRAPPATPERHLDPPICVGLRTLAPPRPRTASCCYPAMEAIRRPLRAVFPALQACYAARTKQDAEGRVAFVFRVEQDGTVVRVCTGHATTMDDAQAARCMVEAIRTTVRYPAMSDEEVALCGLLSFDYPVMFER